MESVAFYTLGCKVNKYDTEGMIDQFKQADYQVVDFDNQADIYIINTCTVTHQGASKSRKIIRRANRRNPEAIIAVTGCYPQVDADEILEIDGVDVVVGTKGKDKIVELIKQASKTDKPINFVQPLEDDESFEEVPVENFSDRTRASIKIQDGCEQFCAYCIIPYTRGVLRSRELTAVRAEVERLVAHGFKEFVLTGIHLGEYGNDKTDLNLAKLIKELIKISGVRRIRLSSIEGTEVSDELIDLIAESEKLCRHLHLPLQSGSDKILKAMNRPYNLKEFKAMVERIRAKVPEIAITTDVIVGFPGENEEDFQASYQAVKELGFSDGHIFKYSKRAGTPAADYDEQVHSKIKKRRSKSLRELINRLHNNYQDRFIGKEMEVLVEKKDEASGIATGYTDNYLRVAIKDETISEGEIVKVELAKEGDRLVGLVVDS